MKNNKLNSFCIIILTIVLICSCNILNYKSIDYSKADNWVVWRDGSVTEKPVDLFFICPSVDSGKNGNLVIDTTSIKIKDKFISALNMERGIYDSLCRVYEPLYTQVTIKIYEFPDDEAKSYHEAAYKDVKNAFLYYLKNENNGRPIVLAGFSQGSEMCVKLLKDVFSDKKIQDKLVAAYVIGWRVTENDLTSYPHLKMAQGETDTGVIISFNSESPETKTSFCVPEKTIGINPLNWKTDSTVAFASENKGSVFIDATGVITNEINNLTGAYIDKSRGTLKLPDINAVDYPPILSVFQPGEYHMYETKIFYRNLEENVKKRIKAFLEKKASVQ